MCMFTNIFLGSVNFLFFNDITTSVDYLIPKRCLPKNICGTI